MADKTQNINIRYNFNTAEIDKAQAALNRANTASNKLQDSAAKTGQSFDKGIVPSIQRMRTEVGRLKTAIETEYKPQNRAKLVAEYNAVNKSLQEAIKNTYGLGKASADSSKGVQSLVLGFKELSRFAGAAIIAGITREAVDLTLSLATLQGQVEGVERGFNRAFINPIEVLNEVREATHGTITDFDLMKRTLQATNLGVGVEHLGTLFEFAAARAQQTGESVDYLVDSIVRGIGRKSPLVLDNLGISVTALKEKFDGASIASKSVAEATEGVAEIAKEQLEKMGGFAETAETRVKALGVAWENVRISLAKRIDSSGFIQFLKDAADGINTLIKGGETLRQEEVKAIAGQRLSALTSQEIFKDRKKNQLAQLDLITTELAETLRLIRVKDQEIEQFQRAKTEAEKQITVDEFGNVVAQQTITFREKAIESLKKQRDVYQALVPMIANALRIMQSEMELENTHIETLDEMRERLKKLVDEFDNLQEAGNNGPLRIAKAEEIKELRHEIERIEALLKDSKELKIKVKLIEDDTLERIQKWFDSGGGLKDTVFNPATGAVFDAAAINASEVIDVDKLEADLNEIAEVIPDKFWTRLRLAFKRKGGESNSMQADLQDALKDLEIGSIGILGDQLMSLADVEQQSFDRRIRLARQFYEENMVLAGNNEKAKDQLRLMEDRKLSELRKKQFIAEQKAMRQKAVIAGATAIVKTFAEYGFTPAAVAATILLAASTASQIAIIDRQQPRFAEGVIDLKGPGTNTSDSIPAWLSRGESVMTAWETKNAGGILKDIRAKKLDDKVLKSLKLGRAPVQSEFNDERIIKAIKDNRPPDVVEQSGIVYKTTNYNDEYRKKVRAKSVRI